MKVKPSATLKQSKQKILIITTMLTIMSTLLVLYTLSNNAKTIYIVQASGNIKSGDLITKDKVQMKEVGRFGLEDNLSTSMEAVIGKYAVKDIASGEFIFGTSLTDDYQRRLSEKARYGAIAVPTNMLDSVAADIKENDFVGVMLSVPDEDNTGEGLGSGTKLLLHPDLAAVRVLGVLDGGGQPAGDLSGKAREGNFVPPAMIIYDVLPKQKYLMNQARDMGNIRLFILPEHIQEAYRQEWGLTGEGQTYAGDIGELFKDADRIEKSHSNITNATDKSGEIMQKKVNTVTDTNKDEINQAIGDSGAEIVDFNDELNKDPNKPKDKSKENTDNNIENETTR